jgi:hypothetical protein
VKMCDSFTTLTVSLSADASDWFTFFIQWRSTTGVRDNIGRQIQTPVHWNSTISKTLQYRTHVRVQFFFLEWPILWPARILMILPGTFCILSYLSSNEVVRLSALRLYPPGNFPGTHFC